MTAIELESIFQEIVRQANDLKNKHTNQINAPVNYACVFSQSPEEYESVVAAAHGLGGKIKETPTGPLFHVKNINTVAGDLKLLKIRTPDKTRPERGDADFTVSDYPVFKKMYLGKDGFGLIERKEMEMVELVDREFNARAYFSNPPLDKLLGIK